ncbi:MAG: nuclear transport factor 2 family protein [Chromatiales bacterium]|nr:nuclear transport factor 2 family protein [Chromatiales bacterium]
MSESENVAILKAGYDHWNVNREQAFDSWLGLIAEDIRFRSLANGLDGMAFTTECNCKEDMLRYFQGLAADWEMLHYTIDEYVAQGDRVVAIGSCGWRHRATGKELETPKVDLVTMRDGKITDFFELYDTARAIACTTP